MKKFITIVFSVALTFGASIPCDAAPVAGTPEARAMYSSRPYRRPVPARQYTIEDVTLEPSVAEPRDVPDPPLDPKNMRSLTAPVPPSTRAAIPVPLFPKAAEQPQTTVERPLSAVAVEQPAKPEVVPKTEEPILEFESESQMSKNSIEGAVAQSPAFVSGTTVDKLYVRLAKIQLEKKNLPETLRFIDKISSPTFQVATLVEFAEYVSRDDNYRSEAEQLYALAINGIEALQNGERVVIPVPAAPAPTVPTTETPVTEPVKPLVPLVEPEPKTPEREFVLIPEEEEVLAPVTEKKQEPVEPPTASREPIQPELKTIFEPLDDIKILGENTGESPKPAEEVPTLENEKEPTLDSEPQEGGAAPERKPSFIIKNGEQKETAVPNSETKPVPEPVKTEEPEVKPTRRPLPKRTIKLEEN